MSGRRRVLPAARRLARLLRLPIFAVGLSATCVAGAQTTQSEEERTVATVNGHPVKLSDVYRRIEALPLGDQIGAREDLDRFAASVVREEILFQSMLASQFGAEPELRDRIKSDVARYLIERHVRQKLNITDADVRRFYDENPENVRNDHVGVSQIVMRERAECERLVAQIDSAAAFADAARAHSIDPATAAKGGEIGSFMYHPGPYGFELETFEMQLGEMRIFDREDGCHLVRVTERVTPPMPPFEHVEPIIREFLEQEQEVTLLRELVEQSARGIEVVPGRN